MSKLNPNAPCDWPVAYPSDPDDPDAPTADCVTCTALDRLTREQRERVETMAIELLWSWSGRRYGLCKVSVRPCRFECAERPSTFSGRSGRRGQVAGWTPALIGGQWYNLGCGMCSSGCTCTPDRATSLELPGNVHAIEEIWVDGILLDPESYTLRDGILYRTDGGVWPECNDELSDPREPGSLAWEITYQRGYPVPTGGQVSAYLLACELAKAMCGDNDCALPRRVQSVTRQGVSVAILDSFEDLDEGRTGIWEIDSWLSSVSFQQASPPQVFSPDIAPGSMRGLFQGLGRGRTR